MVNGVGGGLQECWNIVNSLIIYCVAVIIILEYL